jgi:serine/threonine-protein kinase HipA
MAICRICLGTLDEGREHHPSCLKNLFGTTRPARVDIKVAQLTAIAAAMAGRTSMSGVQRKISVGLSSDRLTLRAVIEGGHYILKPPSEVYPQLPEIELVSMRLAELAQVPIAPCGLVRMSDESMAYVIRRFDRPETGGKLQVEDFCQLAGLPPKEKYRTSAEACTRIVSQYCDEPLVENLRLFRQFLVAWWIGNGDLHLKNLSLVTRQNGLVCLSPAYDMLSTELLLPDDKMALPVGGKDKSLSKGTWMRFAEYASLPEKAALRVVDDLLGVMPDALGMVRHSPLNDDAKVRLEEILTSNGKTLGS